MKDTSHEDRLSRKPIVLPKSMGGTTMCKGGSCGDDKPGYVNHTPKWFKVLFAYLIGFSVILSVLIMLILLVGTYIAITRYL